jgi:short-subunit dehydrogenase
MRHHPAFKENVVIVTGASQGIGEQLAYQLAAQGAWLALAARHAERLEAVASACRTLGGRAIAVPTDLTDETQCRQLIERTIAEYGRIDTLLNNAGMGYPKHFATLPDLHTVRAEIDLNYLGTIYCTYYALPYLKATRGRILGVNSFGGRVGIPATSGYNASKYAMRGFLETLRVELSGTGITVSLAYLGAIRTERLQEAMGSKVDRVPTMDPKRCAALILRQGARRQRQQVMTASGKFLVWLNNWSPRLVDRILGSLTSLSSQE